MLLNLSHVNSIQEHLVSEKESHLIYSNEGLFEIKGDKIYKKKIVDENTEKNKIDNHEIILDKSRIKNTYTVSQIPYNHIFKKMLIKTYSLRDKSRIKLIIEMNEDKIEDIYLSTQELLLTHSLKEDILTFLSVLK